MPEVSNLDILEKKIGQAIEKISQMREVNQVLEQQRADLEKHAGSLESNNQTLREKVRVLELELRSGQNNGADIEAIRGRVDSILSKFELLDI